jgi:D-beta-D-heptose 7-phosphate kinase/D-beta-D-heptose 1-phosphate adenosyltransferase
MVRVFVNGSFDLLHTGHLDLLNYAKSLGDHLHVAIDTDERIRYNKGYDRPVNPLHIRKAIIQSLKPVNSVSVFGSDDQLINTIRAVSPDIMVKGSDWRGKRVIGEEYCGKVIFYERVNNESTTKIIKDFISRRQLL